MFVFSGLVWDGDRSLEAVSAMVAAQSIFSRKFKSDGQRGKK
jgi:hypothetical protein